MCREQDSNLRRLTPTVLQTVLVGHLSIPAPGASPENRTPISGLQNRRSATELGRLIPFILLFFYIPVESDSFSIGKNKCTEFNKGLDMGIFFCNTGFKYNFREKTGCLLL